MIAATKSKMRTVHAVLIDSTNRTITNVEIEPTLEEYYRLIDCRLITIGQRFGNGDVLFVDDEGMITNPTTFFRLEADGTTFAGNGLILGEEVEDDSENGFYMADAKTKAENLGAWFAGPEIDVRKQNPEVEAMRIRANKFIDSEVDMSLLHDREQGRKHLELVLMLFAVNEAAKVATEIQKRVARTVGAGS